MCLYSKHTQDIVIIPLIDYIKAKILRKSPWPFFNQKMRSSGKRAPLTIKAVENAAPCHPSESGAHRPSCLPTVVTLAPQAGGSSPRPCDRPAAASPGSGGGRWPARGTFASHQAGPAPRSAACSPELESLRCVASQGSPLRQGLALITARRRRNPGSPRGGRSGRLTSS